MKELYARHLPLIGEEGLQKLLNSKILVAGAGGLGSIVLEILVRTGVGKLVIVDQGILDEPDLNRQILYTREDLGKRKVDAAKERLLKLREDVEIETHAIYLDENFTITEDTTLIVDCLDNFKGKFVLSDLAFKFKKPLIHAGISGFYGQITTIIPGVTLSLREIMRNIAEKSSEPQPVIASTPIILGALEANEAIKYITGVGKLLKNKILVVDLVYNDFQIIEIVSS
ncbi:MAG: HesA/MoeB/ThiF family protein [Candidatus Hydrothermia bacterium]